MYDKPYSFSVTPYCCNDHRQLCLSLVYPALDGLCTWFVKGQLILLMYFAEFLL